MSLTLESVAKYAAAMHVLLIEDDADDQQLVNDYLSEAGAGAFTVESVERLSTALARLSERAVDAILLDLFLPDSAGFETFLQTHAQAPNVPIVILSGLDDEQLAIRAVREGAQDYLRKEDLSAEVLVRALRYAVERKQAEEQLRQAQKMEAIGRLAGGVAHDFNNLLGVILGNTEILQSCALHGDAAPRAVGRINQAAKSAASLTAQLLAFSRRQALNPVVLNPSEIVAQAGQLLRHLLRENITLNIQAGPELGCVRADPGQLEQVILNLALNARDAMPQGGTLTIETYNLAVQDGYVATSGPVAPGSYVMLAVNDTGVGMDVDTQAHIFEPFYTTKAEGTGLGLAAVQGIVEQSGGHISVSSEPGCGTTIKIALPRIEAQPERIKLETSPGESRRAPETILLVEDNADLREVGRAFLESNGYTVLEAGSCEEALQVAGKHSGPIHLLLTDVVLPSGGGPEVASRLQALLPEMIVLYMSGYTSDVVALHGDFNPDFPLLQKPFSKNQLLRFVRDALETKKTKSASGTG